MPLTLVINGQSRVFANLTSPVMLTQVIVEMELKGDRIAVEHNGEIAQRTRWAELPVSTGDRLEVVHFVGGGAVVVRETPPGGYWAGNRAIVRKNPCYLSRAGLTIHNICYRTFALCAKTPSGCRILRPYRP